MTQSSQKGTLVYYVFDLLVLDGQDVRKWPLAARKMRLQKSLKPHERLLYVGMSKAVDWRCLRVHWP